MTYDPHGPVTLRVPASLEENGRFFVLVVIRCRALRIFPGTEAFKGAASLIRWTLTVSCVYCRSMSNFERNCSVPCYVLFSVEVKVSITCRRLRQTEWWSASRPRLSPISRLIRGLWSGHQVGQGSHSLCGYRQDVITSERSFWFGNFFPRSPLPDTNHSQGFWSVENPGSKRCDRVLLKLSTKVQLSLTSRLSGSTQINIDVPASQTKQGQLFSDEFRPLSHERSPF